MATDESMRLRPIREDDLPRLARLEAEVEATPWTIGNFKDALSSGYPGAAAVDEADEPTAWAVFMQTLDEAELLICGTAPEHQRRGLMTKLLASALLDMKRMGGRVMHLEVRASNEPAIALYEKLGFRVTGRRPNYYYYSGRHEDAVLMQCAATDALALQWMRLGDGGLFIFTPFAAC